MRVLNPFIFSNDKRYRIARHVFFWLIWISFYAFTQTYRLKEYRQVPMLEYYPVSWGEMLIQIPVDICFCYTVIYFLLPVYFNKGKYFSFFAGYLVVMVVFSCIQNIYFIHAVSWYRMMLGLRPPSSDGSFTLGVLLILGSLNTEGGFAIAIKLGKMFVIKKKEADLLHREKQQMETANMDSSFSPGTFLTRLLKRLYVVNGNDTAHLAGEVDKINNLILYSNYRTSQALLPLDQELSALHDYMSLRAKSLPIEIDFRFTIHGDASNKQLAYNLLIPLAENAFAALGEEKENKACVHAKVLIQTNKLLITIINSKSSDTSTLLGDTNINLQNIEKRLKLIYPGNYNLKKVIEPELLKVQLSIALNKSLSI